MCVSGIECIILGGCVWWMFDGYICLRVNCGLSLLWYVQMRERCTHPHQLDRVGHKPHGGLQDVMVEVWGQHPLVLEPHLPLQQKTIPWPQMGVCLCREGGVRETGSEGIGGTKIFRRRYVTGKGRKASTFQESEFPKWLFHWDGTVWDKCWKRVGETRTYGIKQGTMLNIL